MANSKKSKNLKQQANELNRMAWEFRIMDSIKAQEYSHLAIELCRKIKYKKGLADALRVNAFGYIRKADLNLSSNCLDEAESIYKSLKDKKGLATINEYKGIIERNKGNSGEALEYIFKALEQSKETFFVENEITNLYQLGVTFKSLANYEKALEYLYQSLTLSKTSGFKLMEGYDLNIIGSIYLENDDFDKALENYRNSLQIRQESGDKWGEAGSLDNIGNIYFKIKDYTNATNYTKKSLEITKAIGDKKGEANSLFQLAKIYKETNDLKMALELSNESLQLRKLNRDKRGEAEILLFLASLQPEKINNKDDKSRILKDSLTISKEIKAHDLASKAYHGLYQHYKTNQNFSQAIEHLEQHIQLEKELHKDAINEKLLNLEISLKAEEAKKEAEAIKLKNEELIKLNNEIQLQKKKVEDALTELRSTQAQLIQSEKMASLGELTAGIAHEIQNPLNFVNNFSEVSKELLEEMMEELKKGDTEEVEAIANDIIENLEKINHHGKRADGIVKGMLQHSRTSSGVKEPTEINALADEYFRLAYHGLRAKDKSFNATMTTDFDESIGNIEVIPQDIGRVILNLITNAFYAVTEKKIQLKKVGSDDKYDPTVLVSTKKMGNYVEISVKDNGNGIPDDIKNKIFQPFFTTKPTGQGTGLGLSMSYDIITKGHGGELNVKTTPNIGTEFTIVLPINK